MIAAKAGMTTVWLPQIKSSSNALPLMDEIMEIFLVCAPGLERVLLQEVQEKSFPTATTATGAVVFNGSWQDVWRANLELRGATKVLARIGSFRAAHLAELDKRARKFPWAEFLRRDVPFTVEATCRRSRIYHSGAAEQRIATAITEELGSPYDDAGVRILARIEDNLVTLSIDTSGDLLHRRGAKQAMAKAPLRETLAAGFLRACGYRGTETVLDPLCGSGTFVIEAAEWAMGLQPGRNRNFAFEHLISFKAEAFAALRRKTPMDTDLRFHGSDRDQGAIRAANANAARAGVSKQVSFQVKSISAVTPPEGPAGLVIMNPPYGTRIGETKALHDLYASLGRVMRQRFSGWRVGLITTNAKLAKATELPFKPAEKPVLHGGLKVTLWQTDALP
jgi:putative N6-adenine-specific DNA methylase